jgi:hypothetical protein
MVVTQTIVIASAIDRIAWALEKMPVGGFGGQRRRHDSRRRWRARRFTRDGKRFAISLQITDAPRSDE